MNRKLNEKLGEIKSALGEAKSELNPRGLAQIKDMTRRNDHSGAQIVGAEMLGLKHLAKKMRLVKELHRLEGHMPEGLNEYSYSLGKALDKQAKRDLSPEDYKKFHACY